MHSRSTSRGPWLLSSLLASALFSTLAVTGCSSSDSGPSSSAAPPTLYSAPPPAPKKVAGADLPGATAVPPKTKENPSSEAEAKETPKKKPPVTVILGHLKTSETPTHCEPGKPVTVPVQVEILAVPLAKAKEWRDTVRKSAHGSGRCTPPAGETAPTFCTDDNELASFAANASSEALQKQPLASLGEEGFVLETVSPEQAAFVLGLTALPKEKYCVKGDVTLTNTAKEAREAIVTLHVFLAVVDQGKKKTALIPDLRNFGAVDQDDSNADFEVEGAPLRVVECEEK